MLLGVDVGGTFTDAALVADGRLYCAKSSTTPDDQSRGALAAIELALAAAGAEAGDVRAFAHGTTVATNALLEAKGARVGLITTKGFKQILHLARSQTPGPLAGWIIMIKPDPPASLFVWGDAGLLKRPAVGMVGSRNHSAYGAEAARLLAAGVAGGDIKVSYGANQGEIPPALGGVTIAVSAALTCSYSAVVSSSFVLVPSATGCPLSSAS